MAIKKISTFTLDNITVPEISVGKKIKGIILKKTDS